MTTFPSGRRIVAGALFLGFCALAAEAAPASLSPLDARLTIQITNAPLGQFLDTLSAQTKANFVLTGDADKIRVSLDAKDEKAGEALKSLLEDKGFVYRRLAQSSTYVVASKSDDALMQASERAADALLKGNHALDSRITVAVKNAPLKSFFETVAAQTHVDFTLAPELEKNRTTLYLKKVAARDALEIVLELKKLEIARTGENAFAIKPAS